MAEAIVKDGTWTFDGESVRIVPGRDRGVHKLRRMLGEVAVPLAAVAGIAYEPGRRSGRLRLRIRDGACPLLQATGGGLPDAADPYQLKADGNRAAVAEYFADEVRNALLTRESPSGPADRYLLRGPAVPITAGGVEGAATFDGESIRFEWNWTVSDAKQRTGNHTLALSQLAGVEWLPAVGMVSGVLRFRPRGTADRPKPEHDPNCLSLAGFKRETAATALLAAAVAARLPHPRAPEDTRPPLADPAAPAPALALALAPAPEEAAAHDAVGQDALLRRLRELGELRREGVLTEEEFTAAKQAVLGHLASGA